MGGACKVLPPPVSPAPVPATPTLALLQALGAELSCEAGPRCGPAIAVLGTFTLLLLTLALYVGLCVATFAIF